jgi:hypothetical protein
MILRLLNLSGNVQSSDGESKVNGGKPVLESLSMPEQCNFRMVVSMAGAIQDAASVAWSSSRAVGAELQDISDALRQIEIESGFVRASALGSIEMFSDFSSTRVCLASGIMRQVSQQELQGSSSKSTALTDKIDISNRWIQEENALFSPFSKERICLESAAHPAKSIQSACVNPKGRVHLPEHVHGTDDSTMTGVMLPPQTERLLGSFETNIGFKVLSDSLLDPEFPL